MLYTGTPYVRCCDLECACFFFFYLFAAACACMGLVHLTVVIPPILHLDVAPGSIYHLVIDMAACMYHIYFLFLVL